jgi:hypothetical protein
MEHTKAFQLDYNVSQSKIYSSTKRKYFRILQNSVSVVCAGAKQGIDFRDLSLIEDLTSLPHKHSSY